MYNINMRKYLGVLVMLLICIVPVFTNAQFSGFGADDTNSPVNWTAEDNFVGSDTNVVGNEKVNITTEGNINNDTSILRSAGTNTCTVASNNKTFGGYVDYIGCLVRVSILPFIFAIATVSFVWGVTVMLRNPASEESQAKGRQFILYGIIGFFVITAVYALVAVIRRTFGFGINTGDSAPYEQLKDKALNLK